MFNTMMVKSKHLAHKWPTIITIVSIGTLAVGIYKMCKASMELEYVVHEHDLKDDTLLNDYKDGVISDEEFRNKSIESKIHRIKDVGKLYAPGFLLCAASTFGFLFSNKELGKRVLNAETMALQYHDSYQNLRKNLETAIGKKSKSMIEHNLVPEEVEFEETTKSGDKKIKKRSAMIKDDISNPSVYSVFFDNTCMGFDETSRKNNYEHLLSIQAECQNKLKKRGYLWLTEVYDMLGIYQDPHNLASMNAGWIDPDGKYAKFGNKNMRFDGVIDFGLTNESIYIRNQSNYEPVWLLDFNCYQISHLI